MGTLVSLPVMVVDILESWIRGGVQSYARVVLVDADHATIGPLHMWEFLPSELEIDGIYMFRGLRVALRRVYNAISGQWQRPQSAGKTLECYAFAAIGAVQHDSVRCYVS